MKERNFAVEVLNKDFKSKQVRNLFQKVKAAETQAIALVRLFKEENYLTIDALLARLRAQQIPKVDLTIVTAFLAGYMAGETFETRFDTEVFGDHCSVSDSKSETTHAALIALLTMINEKNVVKLPNRVPRRKRKKIEPARVRK